MLTAITLFLTVTGLVLLPAFTGIGLVCCALGYLLHTLSSRDEAQFMAALMVMAGFGVLATVVHAVLVEFNLLHF